MQLHQDLSHSHYTIRAYGPGQVTVLAPQGHETRPTAGRPAPQAEVLTGSAVLLPTHLLRDWPPRRVEEMTAAHFEAIAALGPEIVVLGSGRGLRFPATPVLAPLRERGIGVEVMDTGAACRTYNILVAEGRIVAAVLLMIEPG